MATGIQFLTEEWLKDNTPLTDNIDVKEIYPFINAAQDIYIKDKLGKGLYDRLWDGIDNNNLNSDEINLLVLIRPCLAYYIVYEALPFLNAKIRNIGVVETADAKQANADRADRKELRAEVLRKAEYYLVRINNYLCTNYALFPEYDHSTCGCCGDNGPNKQSGYTCDLNLDNDYNCLDREWIKKYYRY